MDNNHMKSFSTLLDIRKIKIKTTMRQHSTLYRMAINKKIITSVGLHARKLIPENPENSSTDGGNANW